MNTTTTQDAFHPMLGHVADGVTVRMNNGDVCIIRGTMRGWQIAGPDGKLHGEPTTNANVLASLIATY